MSDNDFAEIANKIKHSNVVVFDIVDTEAHSIYNASLTAAEISSQRTGMKISELEKNKFDSFRRLKRAAEKVGSI